MKNHFTLSIFFLFVSLLCFGCGDPEDLEDTTASIYNPLLDEPDKRLLDEPNKPLLRLKDKDWEKLKGDDWIALTDEEVEELLNLVIPQRWVFETENPVLYQKYRAATYFQRFGDIPQVRYLVEFMQQPSEDKFVEVNLLSIAYERHAAFLEASYFLFPSADTRRSLEEIRKQMDEEKERHFLDRLRRKNPETWIEHKHAALLRRHGDIPEVDIIADFLRKLELQLPRTDKECHTYFEAYDALYDHSNTASAYEFYALLEALHQVRRFVRDPPSHTLKKYREARAAGISLYDIDWDDP